MDTSPAPILLFDVMSTLVYDPIMREIPSFFGLTLDELYESKHPSAWVKFERGEISEQSFYDIYFPDRAEPIDAEAMRAVLHNSYRWLDGMKALVEAVHRRNYEMHAFSNYPIWYRIIDDKLALSKYLNWTFVSCRTGIRKPDPRAYHNAVQTLGVTAEDCLFVDDRRSNCEAAKKAGMQALLFEDAPTLRAQLSARNIL